MSLKFSIIYALVGTEHTESDAMSPRHQTPPSSIGIRRNTVNHQRVVVPCLGVPVLIWLLMPVLNADEYPLNNQEREFLTGEQQATLERYPAPDATSDNSTQIHSRRADALFFLGRFKESVAEYQAMVTNDPTQDASHWRLGIALFFAGQPQLAAAQFDKYHSFDQVDRENGIWRYLSHYKAQGAEAAKKELLRYEKDDREPFPAVYRLFDDGLTPAEALKLISDDLPEDERDKRLFYTELYIGMLLVVQNKPDEAILHLRAATSRKWPRKAGFGPNYMWHVGRVQLDLLLAAKSPPEN
jgi:lipoprotein NlpI